LTAYRSTGWEKKWTR